MVVVYFPIVFALCVSKHSFNLSKSLCLLSPSSLFVRPKFNLPAAKWLFKRTSERLAMPCIYYTLTIQNWFAYAPQQVCWRISGGNKIREIYHFIELFAFQQCNWSINILPHGMCLCVCAFSLDRWGRISTSLYNCSVNWIFRTDNIHVTFAQYDSGYARSSTVQTRNELISNGSGRLSLSLPSSFYSLILRWPSSKASFYRTHFFNENK